MMPAAELLDWMALYKIEPWGVAYETKQLAGGFAILANLLVAIAKNSGVKFRGRPKFETKDFLAGSSMKGPTVAPSQEELKTKLFIFAQRVNARFEAKERASKGVAA